MSCVVCRGSTIAEGLAAGQREGLLLDVAVKVGDGLYGKLEVLGEVAGGRGLGAHDGQVVVVARLQLGVVEVAVTRGHGRVALAQPEADVILDRVGGGKVRRRAQHRGHVDLELDVLRCHVLVGFEQRGLALQSSSLC